MATENKYCVTTCQKGEVCVRHTLMMWSITFTHPGLNWTAMLLFHSSSVSLISCNLSSKYTSLSVHRRHASIFQTGYGKCISKVGKVLSQINQALYSTTSDYDFKLQPSMPWNTKTKTMHFFLICWNGKEEVSLKNQHFDEIINQKKYNPQFQMCSGCDLHHGIILEAHQSIRNIIPLTLEIYSIMIPVFKGGGGCLRPW